jgi:hypothetical protein
MVDLDAMAEEQDRMLRELAELGMDFARDLKAQVKTVTSVAEAESLALAFHRVQRGLRLTLALRSKLAREHLEIGKLRGDAASRAADRRKAQIRAVLEPEIFTEDADQKDADQLRERLIERLDDDALFDEFLHAPFDTAVARIRKDIGLPEPLTSPIAAAMAGGGPRPAEGVVEGASGAHGACGSPPPPSALRRMVPLPRCAGEEKKKPAPS